jgi:hypothetical protein
VSTPQLSKPKEAAPKKPSRKEFDEYCATRERRKELEREAATLKKREDELAVAISDYAIHAGGKTRTVECCGHRASIASVAAAAVSVAWRVVAAYRSLAGQAAYAKIKSETPERDVLTVEKL